VSRELAAKIADAVLYEGYMLYPYRPSALKNRQRWTFGILYPPGYDEVRGGTERCRMRSECVLVTRSKATVHVQLRFLHLAVRQVLASANGCVTPIASLMVDNRLVESWDEGDERSVILETPVPTGSRAHTSFRFAASNESEPLRASGRMLGRVNRNQQEVTGQVTVSWQDVGAKAFKIAVEVSNETFLPEEARSRSDVLLRSMLSAHTILRVQGGEFISLLDPPQEFREAVNSCTNVGNFPVLVGEPGALDTLLCSPILLYDYPQIAPESAGDFFDATEIDEMLTLRLMTLTEEEKREMRFADERARDLLQRTEETARRQLQRTHGAIRSLRPGSESHD
jgi:hypothetical protein